MPRSAAAEVIRPEWRLSAWLTVSRSTDSRASRKVVGATRSPASVNSRSSAVMRLPSAMMTARLIRFCNSRTFPGQAWLLMARMASGPKTSFGRSHCTAARCRNSFATSRRSSPRWRKRREFDHDDGQPEIKVLAEFPGRDRVLQVGVSGRDDARVGLEFLPAADALEGSLLQKPEQLHLDGRRKIADFIQEQCPASGRFDQAFALHVRSGEGAFLVSEELALEQIFGDGAAIDRDKGPAAARAAPVDGERGHFLPGAAFAEEKDGRVGGGYLSDEPEHALHLRSWSRAFPQTRPVALPAASPGTRVRVRRRRCSV